MKTPNRTRKIRAEVAVYGKFITEPDGPAAKKSDFGFIVHSSGMSDEKVQIKDMLLSGNKLAYQVDETAARNGATLMAFTDSGFWVARFRSRPEAGEEEKSARVFPLFHFSFFPGFLNWTDLPAGLIYKALSGEAFDPPIQGDPSTTASVTWEIGYPDQYLDAFINHIETSPIDQGRLGWLSRSNGETGPASSVRLPDFGLPSASAARHYLAMELEALRLLFAYDRRNARFPIVIDAKQPEGAAGVSYTSDDEDLLYHSEMMIDWNDLIQKLEAKSSKGFSQRQMPRMKLANGELRKVGVDPFPINLARQAESNTT